MTAIEKLRRLGFGSEGFLYLRKPVLFPAMLHGCGYSRQVDSSYDLEGLTRTCTDVTLFQYTVAGHGRLTYEGTTYTVHPGQAMLLHFPHENRYWLPAGWPPWEFLWVALFGGELMRLWRQLEKRSGPLLAMPQDAVPVATAVGIYEQATRGGPQSPCRASSLAYRLLMELLDEAMPHAPSGPKPAHVRRVIAFCHEHLSEPIGVSQMAAVSGYSRYHFTRLFEAAEGLPPARYVAMLRMERAVQLLREDQRASIAEIARRCGFKDVNYFCKVFRKATGTSPGAFAEGVMH